MSKGITISEKHGVNPMVVQCLYCGRESGELALLGKLKGDVEAPRMGVLDGAPCAECTEYMEKGIICISVDPDKSPPNAQLHDAYRSGGWCVLTEAAIKRMPIDETMREQILERRIMLIENEVWDNHGFPERNSDAG